MPPLDRTRHLLDSLAALVFNSIELHISIGLLPAVLCEPRRREGAVFLRVALPCSTPCSTLSVTLQLKRKGGTLERESELSDSEGPSR